MTLKQHVGLHDRQIAAIRKLVETGMKMLVRIEASQKKTDTQLQALIASLKRGGNGNGRTKH